MTDPQEFMMGERVLVDPPTNPVGVSNSAVMLPPGGQKTPTHLDSSSLEHQGRLEDRPVPVILAYVARHGLTGTLLLRREQVKKIVYIVDGVPRSVKSNLLFECLGRLLVREGLITEQICDESIKRVKNEGRLQGEVLKEMQVLTSDDLNYVLERQFDLKLFDTFAWESGLFQFRVMDSDRVGKPKQRIAARNPFALVLSGVRAAVTVKRIAGELEPYLQTAPELLIPWDELKIMGLSEAEWEWMQRMDGRRTLSEVVNFDTASNKALKLIYALVSAGLMTFRGC